MAVVDTAAAAGLCTTRLISLRAARFLNTLAPFRVPKGSKHGRTAAAVAMANQSVSPTVPIGTRFQNPISRCPVIPSPFPAFYPLISIIIQLRTKPHSFCNVPTAGGGSTATHSVRHALWILKPIQRHTGCCCPWTHCASFACMWSLSLAHSLPILVFYKKHVPLSQILRLPICPPGKQTVDIYR